VPAVSATAGSDTFFGGVTSLSEQLDREVLVVLRDGNLIIGTLSSFDAYGSLVLERSRERHVAGGKFCDVDMGVYLVRGENVAMVGEVDAEREAAAAAAQLLVRAEWEEVSRLEAAERERARAEAKAVAAADGAVTGWGSATE